MFKNKLRKINLINRKKKYKSLDINFSLLKNILKKPNLLKKRKIGAYFPINYEIDCFEILKKLEQSGYKISLPVIKKKMKWIFLSGPLNIQHMWGKLGYPSHIKKKRFIPT